MIFRDAMNHCSKVSKNNCPYSQDFFKELARKVSPGLGNDSAVLAGILVATNH